ncbi:MAG: Hpt domain-containing protein, partial [Cyanobacteria bacterium J06639_1]
LTAVLDRDRLDDIAAGDVELEREILALYCGDARRLVQTARDAIAAADFAQLERSMHQLKGSSGNLGAIAVAAASERLVVAARNGDLDAARRWLAETESAFVQTDAAFSAYIGRL